jgi:hypothetical protein
MTNARLLLVCLALVATAWAPRALAQAASAVPLKPQPVGAACQEVSDIVEGSRPPPPTLTHAPLPPPPPTHTHKQSSVCASGFCIDGVCADVLAACKATATKSGGKACPKFSGQAFKPTPLTSPPCAAAALALRLPSAASATNACYKAGEGELCVVSTPKKQGGAATYGVVCNGLAVAEEAAMADAEATPPAAAAAAAPAGSGADKPRAAAVAAALAGVAAAVAVLI